MTTVIDTPEKIELFRLCSLRAALKLEIAGMKRNGRSASAILKEELNLTRSTPRPEVLRFVDEEIKRREP